MIYRVILAMAIAAVSQGADLTFGTAEAAAGQKATGFIEVPAGVDAATSLPVIVINGAKPGPKLALIAGAHGTEYASIVALTKMPEAVKAAELSGALIILPLINVASFQQKVVHRNPVDNKGVGGYPGKADGTQSERIAYAVYNQVIEKCDHLIDYHGGDLDEDLHPYSYFTKTDKLDLDAKTRDMVLAFGLRTIIIKPARGRGLDTTALGLGKASITVEAGHAGTTEAGDIDVLIQGTLNVMRYLKMLPGAVHAVEHPLWIRQFTVLKGEQDGIFFPSVVPEAYVAKGMKIGYVTNFVGEKTLDVIAPVAGIVLYIDAVPTMKKGDNVGYIGEIGDDPLHPGGSNQ